MQIDRNNPITRASAKEWLDEQFTQDALQDAKMVACTLCPEPAPGMTGEYMQYGYGFLMGVMAIVQWMSELDQVPITQSADLPEPTYGAALPEERKNDDAT